MRFAATAGRARSGSSPIKKSVWDFKSMGCGSYQSEHKAQCNAHYDACFTGCGGQIVPKRECVMFCDDREK